MAFSRYYLSSALFLLLLLLTGVLLMEVVKIWYFEKETKKDFVQAQCPVQAVSCHIESLNEFCKEELYRCKHELLSYRRRMILNERVPKQHCPEQMLSLPKPTIYAITPTYARPVQKAELTRLVNTFINVPNFHWIVVEDAAEKSELVSKLLMKSGLRYTHLSQQTPSEYKLKPKDPHWLKPRGVLQRNKGLSWLRQNIDADRTEGVVYFADDDNTYDLEIFEEMRSTKKVSVWPVGFAGYLRYESPIVKNGTVVGWFTYWKPERKFAIDMAGFAVNLRLFFDHPNAEFSIIQRGQTEPYLLSSLGVTLGDLEPKADGCTKILVWHTRTEAPNLSNEAKLLSAGKRGSDPKMEV